MARTRVSFRDKVAANSTQQRNKTANYGHIMIPRGIPIFKEEAGSRVSIDIIPYVVTDANHPDKNDELELATVDSLWYRRPYKLHRGLGADGKTSIVCPTSVGKRCPICEYRTKMLNEGANWQDDAMKALRASDRNIYYVVPKNDKKLEDRPHLWDMSQFIFQSPLNDEIEENESYGDFPDLEEGLTLNIRFSEESFGKNKYAGVGRIDFVQRNYVYEEAQIEALPSLDDILVIKDYKEVEQIFYEAGGEDEEDGAPAPRERPAADDGPRMSTRAKGNGATRPKPGPEAEPEKPKTERRRPEPESEAEAPKKEAGTGGFTRRRREEPAAEAEEPTPEETGAKADDREARRAARVAREARGNDDCPSGHAFGADTDKHPECEDCKVWTKCMDALEAAQAA